MVSPNRMLIILLSATLVSGHLFFYDLTSKWPWKIGKIGPSQGVDKTLEGNLNRHPRSVSSHHDNLCLEGTPLGDRYSGKVNITVSGRICQAWSASEPHELNFTDVGKVGETEAGDHNFCRNPSGEALGVWCYTTDKDKEWEYCSVPLCNTTYDCQEGKPLGVSYKGSVSKTRSGNTCQVWAVESLGSHYNSDEGMHNHCRNPGGKELSGVWCYNNDQEIESCPVPRCDATYDCQEGHPLGQSYSGTMNVTESGWACLNWAFAGLEKSIGDHNHCRNPPGSAGLGVWCFSANPDKVWEYCSLPECAAQRLPGLKVLDFSSDNDQKPDSNGRKTMAILLLGAIPESFTICSAFMVESWTTDFSTAYMFSVVDMTNDENQAFIKIFAASNFTQYQVLLKPIQFVTQTNTIFFPLQWTRACLSLDFAARKVALVVDGQLMEEKEYSSDEAEHTSGVHALLLGVGKGAGAGLQEFTGRVADLNIFSSSLSSERMKGITTAGEVDCGTPGDLVNWEKAEWMLFSQAKLIEVDRDWEGSCRKESHVQVFKADFGWHHRCMQHCQKISGGRSPPVTTREQWVNLTKEFDLITPGLSRDLSILPRLWLSVTEGDKKGNLERLGHWPETELVDNNVIKLEAQEETWRDYYSGERVMNWTKPYHLNDEDTLKGKADNCMVAFTKTWRDALGTNKEWEKSWYEESCSNSAEQSCPCQYPGQPLLKLRGLCQNSLIEKVSKEKFFTMKHFPGNPDNIILLGLISNRIEYDDSHSQWILTDAESNVNATSEATKPSFLLGKHLWTISNDDSQCGKGKPYTTLLKLTGCAEDEFTCDDGQCIKMERRCDQVTGKEPNCRDESDEMNCQLIIIKNREGYNKNIPPIESGPDGSVIPADVSILITLMKVVEIEEVDHSIHLQFQISLSWKENRVKYQNMKEESSLNTLTDDDIKTIWLPLVVYDNTDQKEVTRLGEDGNGELGTSVSVTRESNFTRSGDEEVDEAEIFEGSENRLTMDQMYTWEFQCNYQLQRYPFDTQVQGEKENVELKLPLSLDLRSAK